MSGMEFSPTIVAWLPELNLVDNNLTGSIPPELGSLYNLEWLELTGNWA